MKNALTIQGDSSLILLKLKGDEPLNVIVDTSSLPALCRYSWKLSTRGYAENCFGHQMHRVITGCPKGKVVDHINGDKLDNRQSNLRITTQLVNTHNRRIRPKNVHYQSGIGKWRVRFYYNWKSHGFGCYDSEAEAIRVAEQIRAKLVAGEPIEGNHQQGKNHKHPLAGTL